MAEVDGELTVAQRLGRLLDRGLLPAGGPAEAAERLIERLERPARVALLGLPGSGKSAILNLLAGMIVVPETLRLPTIVVQHGAEPRMLCTLADGRTEVIPGTDLSEVLRLAPALVTVEMDLPALKVITLLEVSAGPMEAEQRRATAWAQKRADIVVWCTTSYLPKEQVVWEDMPDVVKDNGFLFLTKVDLLGSRDAAQGMLERVEQRAGEEFRQVLAISAKQARAAMQAPGGLDREMFRDSGAGAVITAIKTRVQMARRADMDMAELLLARHVEASEMVARRFAETGDTKAPEWVPPPEDAQVAPAPVVPEPTPVVAAPPPEPEPVVVPPALPPEPVIAAPLPEPEPDAAPPEPEPIAATPAPLPEVEAPVAPVPAPTAVQVEVAPPEPAPEPVTEVVTGRKRFADRIKQLPTDGTAPQVPLRTTWKSKAELAAPPASPPAPEPEPEPELVEAPTPAREPEPEPIAHQPEPVPVPEPQPVPGPGLESEPEADPTPAEPVAAAEPELPESDEARIARMIAAAAAQAQRAPRERKPRDGLRPAAAPAPVAEPVEEEPRPRLFGARRGAGTEPGSPLPDLSSLRARPEEMLPPEDAGEEPEDAEEEVADAHVPEPEPAPQPAAPVDPVESPPPVERVARLRTVERAPRDRAPSPPMTNAPVVTPRERPAAPPPQPRAPRERAPAPPMTNVPMPGTAPMREAPVAEPALARRERPRIAARAVSAPALTPAAPMPVSAVEQALLDEAVGLIVARTAELVGEVNPDEKVPVDLILDHGRETAERLMAILSRATSPEIRRIKGDLGEVQDLIMLMQLEKGRAPADDALTLLLQLRRELETLRAA
ncbi:ABC transporter ATP-binding protein [Tabrizicola aquatica]|uniref:ATP-binding cassette domain-containing protein n=1 Tax=Tabrizicola aquatica TaxID=909926 RepID=UPI000CD2F79A|nr:ABC transporter ATP-binding protein [Tabrizicola aquatica]